MNYNLLTCAYMGMPSPCTQTVCIKRALQTIQVASLFECAAHADEQSRL